MLKWQWWLRRYRNRRLSSFHLRHRSNEILQLKCRPTVYYSQLQKELGKTGDEISRMEWGGGWGTWATCHRLSKSWKNSTTNHQHLLAFLKHNSITRVSWNECYHSNKLLLPKCWPIPPCARELRSCLEFHDSIQQCVWVCVEGRWLVLVHRGQMHRRHQTSIHGMILASGLIPESKGQMLTSYYSEKS